MTPEQFIKPLSTHYTNENYDFYVIYAPEVVKAVFSQKQLAVLLNEIELSDEFTFPKNILHEIYVEIVKSAPTFLQYRTYYDVLTYENHEILWRTEYQFEKQVVILEVNLRKQVFCDTRSLQ